MDGNSISVYVYKIDSGESVIDNLKCKNIECYKIKCHLCY